jgi:hypothetical protein
MGECPCEDRDALLATLDTLNLYCGSGREAQYKSLQNFPAVGSNPTFHSKFCRKMAVRYTSLVFLTDAILDKSYRANGSRVIAIHNGVLNVQSNQLLVYPDDEKWRDVHRVVPV